MKANPVAPSAAFQTSFSGTAPDFFVAFAIAVAAPLVPLAFDPAVALALLFTLKGGTQIASVSFARSTSHQHFIPRLPPKPNQ